MRKLSKLILLRLIVSLRSLHKINWYLMRARSFRYCEGLWQDFDKKRCEVCMNVSETSIFTSSVAGETKKTNHKLNCYYNCLTYLSSCKYCSEKYFRESTASSRYLYFRAGSAFSKIIIGNNHHNNNRNNHRDINRKCVRKESCIRGHPQIYLV